jgi:hypothetical protein
MVKENGQEPKNTSDWVTPTYVSIKKKKSKRISPYLETDVCSIDWSR